MICVTLTGATPTTLSWPRALPLSNSYQPPPFFDLSVPTRRTPFESKY